MKSRLMAALVTLVLGAGLIVGITAYVSSSWDDKGATRSPNVTADTEIGGVDEVTLNGGFSNSGAGRGSDCWDYRLCFKCLE